MLSYLEAIAAAAAVSERDRGIAVLPVACVMLMRIPRRHRGVPCDRDDGIVLLDMRGHVAVVVLHLAAAAIAAQAHAHRARTAVCVSAV